MQRSQVSPELGAAALFVPPAFCHLHAPKVKQPWLEERIVCRKLSVVAKCRSTQLSQVSPEPELGWQRIARNIEFASSGINVITSPYSKHPPGLEPFPEGDLSHSPGLSASAGYPGFAVNQTHLPQRGCDHQTSSMTNTRGRKEGHNPVGQRRHRFL